MQLGTYTLPNPVFVAPMAGVTDRPFRRLCRDLGAGYAVSEMAAKAASHACGFPPLLLRPCVGLQLLLAGFADGPQGSDEVRGMWAPCFAGPSLPCRSRPNR